MGDIITKQVIVEEQVIEAEVDESIKDTRPLRLSVSALRDYRRCPRYYKLKRVDKLPESPSHHMAAGSIVHNAFYAGLANLVTTEEGEQFLEPDEELVTKGKELAKTRVELMFDILWNWDRENWRDPVIIAGLNHFSEEFIRFMTRGVSVPENFTKGSLKALKTNNYYERSLAWREHYKNLLLKSFEQFLVELSDGLFNGYKLTTIEKRVSYELGGIDMLGFIDIELSNSDGRRIAIDLKSGMNKPSEKNVQLDDQMQTYYEAGGYDEVVLYHMRSGSFITSKRDEKLIKSLDEMAAQDALSIESGFFPKRYDPMVCNYCSFYRECHG